MTLFSLKRRNTGFSLVELMVGMVLGLMLIGGAVSIYLASKQSYVEVEQVAALTENARFAEQVVGHSLRHIGFLGEVTANKVEVASSLVATALDGDCNTPAEAGAYNLTRLAFAATTDDSGAALGCIDDGYVPDIGPLNDVLVIKHVTPRPYTDGPRVGGDTTDPTVRDGIIDTPGALQNGRVYVMTSRVGGRLFDGATPPSITVGGEFPGGTAWEYQYEVLYIRDGAVPRLSRKVLAYNTDTFAMEFPDEPEDLAEGVEQLQLLFGYDADGDGEVDTYKDQTAITAGGNWASVESVEVYMLVRSATPDAQYTDVKTYRLGDVSVGPYNDNFRRLISHTSISLRNLKLMIRGDA